MSNFDKWELFLDFKFLAEKVGMEKSELQNQLDALEMDLWGDESIEIQGVWAN